MHKLADDRPGREAPEPGEPAASTAPNREASGPPLAPNHLDELRASGLSDETVSAAGLATVTDPKLISGMLGHVSPAAARKLGACLVFPFRDPDGNPMTRAHPEGGERAYVRLKPSHPRADKKGKPIKYESPAGTPNRLYIPPGARGALDDPAVPLLVTEGEKKALAATQHGFPCVGLVGVYGFQKKREKAADGKPIGPRELIPDLDRVAWAGRCVVVCFDSDAAGNPNVGWAEYHLAELLTARGAVVRVARLPSEPDGAKNGIDDFLVRHGPAAFCELVAAATPPARSDRKGGTPEIVIGTDEFRVADEAAAALAAEPDLYQRAGALVQVQEQQGEDEPEPVIRRPVGSHLVREIPPPLLRSRLTRSARFVRVKATDEGKVTTPAHPPGWCVQAVHARGDWPGVRRLEAIVTHPVLLPDGSILGANGYDRRSQLLVSVPPDLTLGVRESPTKGDVAAALAALDDVLADFPFETPAHRAAWFAGLLTPLAWFAFDGPAPLFLIDANVRGAGKGLLGDVIALTVTGRRFPTMSYTSDREELRKKITTLAVEGERLVMLDNLAGAVGNDILDAALTSDRWKDRLLGGNRVYDGPLNVTWFATGNNVQMHADTARRVCHARMETPEENPELKTGFRYADLRTHVRENRGRLLSAALTLLRGWYAAGKPRHGLPAWGSFEGWSAVVREAVVFARLPDPGETRQALQTSADRDAATMAALIAVLERFDPDRRGVTAAEMVDEIKSKEPQNRAIQSELKSAVEDLCGRIDGRALGYKLRHFARRNFGGRMIDRAGGGHGGVVRWVTVAAGAVPTRVKPSPPSPPSPPSDTPRGGDGGDGGDVPAAVAAPPKGKSARRRYGNNDRPHELRS
jgi:hypothetical protein